VEGLQMTSAHQSDLRPAAAAHGADSDVQIRETANAVFIWALTVGFGLVIVSMFGIRFNLTTFAGLNLILATGIGILLFAFGTRAVLRISYIVMTGAGAVAAAAFWGLMHYSLDDFVQVNLTSPIVTGDKHAQISVGSPRSFLGRQENKSYYFIALRSELNKTTFSIDYSIIDNKTGETIGGSGHVFECIPIEILKNNIGRGVILEWRIDNDLKTITMPQGKEFRDDASSCRDTTYSSIRVVDWLSVSSAYSQVAQPDFDELIQNLRSESSQIRRDSRATLAENGLNSVAPLLKAMHDESDYRVQLGGAVALASFLRENKEQAARVDAVMTSDDYSMMVDQAASDDRTIRIYASEFLSDLGSQRIIAPIASKLTKLPLLSQSSEANINSLISILRRLFKQSDTAGKESIVDAVQPLKGKVGPNTDKLIGDILSGP
jgi:hypothetical protein